MDLNKWQSYILPHTTCSFKTLISSTSWLTKLCVYLDNDLIILLSDYTTFSICVNTEEIKDRIQVKLKGF